MFGSIQTNYTTKVSSSKSERSITNKGGYMDNEEHAHYHIRNNVDSWFNKWIYTIMYSKVNTCKLNIDLNWLNKYLFWIIIKRYFNLIRDLNENNIYTYYYTSRIMVWNDCIQKNIITIKIKIFISFTYF